MKAPSLNPKKRSQLHAHKWELSHNVMAGKTIERGDAPQGLADGAEELTSTIEDHLRNFMEKEEEAMSREADRRLEAAVANENEDDNLRLDEDEDEDESAVPIATYFEDQNIEDGLCMLPGDLREALFFILFRIVARVVYEEDNLKLKSHRKYLIALKKDRQNILSGNQPDSPNMPATLEDHENLKVDFPHVASLLYKTPEERKNDPNSKKRAVASEDEVIKMLVDTVYPPPGDSEQTRSSHLKALCSRKLLHYVTGLFKKLEARGDDTQEGSVKAFSKGDFFPTLVNALLNRGKDKCSLSNMKDPPPEGCLVPHKISSDWYKHFPANIEVNLGNAAHPSLPISFISPGAATSESCYTPLSDDANHVFAGRDNFWQCIKRDTEDKAEHYLHTVLFAALYHDYKQQSGGGQSLQQRRFIDYVLSNEVTSDKIDMKGFFESGNKLKEALKQFWKGKKDKVKKEDYDWNVERHSALGQKIANALNENDLHQINSVAREGMTTELSGRLHYIRKEYQKWRNGLAAEKANTPRNFFEHCRRLGQSDDSH